MPKGFHRKRLSLALVLGLSTGWVHAAAPDSSWTRSYNAQGLVGSLDGPRTDVGDVTHYTYDAQGRLATVTDALGHVTTYGDYDSFGQPGQITDPNGVVTTVTYTPQEWAATITHDSTGTPSTTTLTYDEAGDLTQTKDADGVLLTYTYDGARRITDITDGAGNRIHYTLDAAGNRTKEETFDPSNKLTHAVSRTFTPLSQLLTLTDALGHTVLSYSYPDGYDAAGHPTHSTDAAGTQRIQSYDALGRLVSTIDDAGGTNAATKDATTLYSYDVSDNLTSVTDPSGLTTTYTYDGLSHRTALRSPDTGTATDTYDAAGNRLVHTDAKGIVSTMTYDALNRLVSITYPDSTQNIAYHYDEVNSVTGCSSSYPIGHLTRIVENTVTTVYCYDAQGRVIEKQQIVGTTTNTTGYAYTAAGRLNGIVYPSSTLVTYTRDSDGRIQSLSVTPPNGTASTVVSSVTYQPFGPVSGYTLGNGQTVSRTYDANYRLTDLTSPAFSLHVARDAMGDITAIGDAPGANPATETYSYDPLYRLAGITEANGSTLESVTYSPTGDRLSKTGSGLATGAYSYNANTHQLVGTGSYARSVDANGNITAITAASGNLGFGYNDRNRLTVAQVAGSTVGSYTYDALGERIQKVSGTASETYSYDEGQQLLSEQGATNRDYVWMGGIPVANVDTTGTASTIAYVTADQLGTPRAVADASGNALWTWPYAGNAWGEGTPTSSGYTYNLRFHGQYYDAESGLNYNVNRDYDPGTGRYIEFDPLGLTAGPNGYAYVGGNPISNIDPFGLWQVTITADLGIGGLLTFGYNSGQFNIGGYVGIGEGASVSVNPDDVGCHEAGSWRATRGDARLGVGVLSANVSATVGPGVNDGEVTVGTPIKSLAVGVAVSNGQYSQRPIAANVTLGESAFLGYGGQTYFGH